MNYLDDFLFIYFTEGGCNQIVVIFLQVCEDINFPVSLDKTEWATTCIVFLGMLLDGEKHLLSISLECCDEFLHMVQIFKGKTKATVKDLQKLAGHLNFVSKAVVPGRAFTRRMYAKFAGSHGEILNSKGQKLKPHHHVHLDREFKLDCQMWEVFLKDLHAVNRPFVDLDKFETAESLNFYSDASAKEILGFGAIFGDRWIFGRWEENFVKSCSPSIEFLELFALCAGIFTWQNALKQMCIIVNCDNMSVVHMVNKLTSSCQHCMKLIRLLTLNNLKHDRRVFVRHVEGKRNSLSNALSRQDLNRFFCLAPASVN